MHIHIDTIGGIAGDMFCAAMLDTFPQLYQPLCDFLGSLPLFNHFALRINDKKQHEIAGKQFVLTKYNRAIEDNTHVVFHHIPKTTHGILNNHHNEHHHYHWADIQIRLKQTLHDKAVYACAMGIYTLLAEAESDVHDMPLDKIMLHEVGANDALIDIISAAYLICHSGVLTWSYSSLPWGGGTTQCAHGEIPVPAPATLKILVGFRWNSDCELGERVTPTGAAILAWLIKHHQGTLSGDCVTCGYGFGQKQLKMKPNAVRLCLFADKLSTVPHEPVSEYDPIYMVQCDIDDMSQELLAIAMTQLRNVKGVIDITSHHLMGKKNRWITRVELLCYTAQFPLVCNKILLETTTLGLRYWPIKRYKLDREAVTVSYLERDWPVKIAKRPDNNITAKLEADAISDLELTYRQRLEIKNVTEQLAVDDYINSSKNKYHE